MFFSGVLALLLLLLKLLHPPLEILPISVRGRESRRMRKMTAYGKDETDLGNPVRLVAGSERAESSQQNGLHSVAGSNSLLGSGIPHLDPQSPVGHQQSRET